MTQTASAVDIDVGSAPRELGVGWFDVCVLTDTGGVKCWGENLAGETGTGASYGLPVGVPTDVVGLGGAVAHVIVGYEHACAQLVDGRIMCWGSVTGGATQPSTAPVEVVGF